jgi:outer membrane protein assembly factor BamB
MWGDGASPILHDGRVILNAGPGKKTFVTSIDLATGKTVWEVEEPFEGTGDNNESNKPMGSWCTPFIVKVGGKDQILCSLPKRVLAYEPADGKVIWSCDGLRFGKGDLVYSSPVVVGDICVIFGGYNGPGMGIKLGGKGDVTQTHRLWHVDSPKNPQSIGSGVALDGRIYVPYAGANRIDCIDPKTGKAVWQDKAEGVAFWGSIVHAAGRLYVTDQKGTTVVFKASPEKFELLAANKLNEPSNSTPAVCWRSPA